jgi:hypothetical protein
LPGPFWKTGWLLNNFAGWSAFLMSLNRKWIIALMVVGLTWGGAGNFGVNSVAEAKKKGGAAKGDAEVQKIVDPINAQLSKLMLKIQARALLSPDEAAKLMDIKYQLVDAYTQTPQSALLVKPLYETAIIFSQREAFNDAYELFSTLYQGFPTTPYGLKSKGQMAQLEKRFGADYFAADGATPTDAGAANPASAASPKKL